MSVPRVFERWRSRWRRLDCCAFFFFIVVCLARTFLECYTQHVHFAGAPNERTRNCHLRRRAHFSSRRRQRKSFHHKKNLINRVNCSIHLSKHTQHKHTKQLRILTEWRRPSAEKRILQQWRSSVAQVFSWLFG